MGWACAGVERNSIPSIAPAAVSQRDIIAPPATGVTRGGQRCNDSSRIPVFARLPNSEVVMPGAVNPDVRVEPVAAADHGLALALLWPELEPDERRRQFDMASTGMPVL